MVTGAFITGLVTKKEDNNFNIVWEEINIIGASLSGLVLLILVVFCQDEGVKMKNPRTLESQSLGNYSLTFKMDATNMLIEFVSGFSLSFSLGVLTLLFYDFYSFEAFTISIIFIGSCMINIFVMVLFYKHIVSKLGFYKTFMIGNVFSLLSIVVYVLITKTNYKGLGLGVSMYLILGTSNLLVISANRTETVSRILQYNNGSITIALFMIIFRIGLILASYTGPLMYTFNESLPFIVAFCIQLIPFMILIFTTMCNKGIKN